MAREGVASVRLEDAGERIRLVIDVADADCHGRSAELRVVRRVRVKEDRPVDASETLLRRAISSLQATNPLEVARSELRAYTYRGAKIDVEIHTELEIDDGLLIDTEVSQEQQVRAGLKPAISQDAREIVDPRDAFDFITNFRAIPPASKAVTAALLALGGIVILVNSWIGWHDQWVPDAMTWLYDHRDSDGDSESPLFKSLTASGAFGLAIWYAVRRQLRKYMSFDVVGIPARLELASEIEVARLVRGRSRVDLNDVVVRVVGCNMEKGQYKRGSGTKERTVGFRHPVRAVILYERRLARIPAHLPVERYLDGTIRFEPLFRALYPPQVVGGSHGIEVHWEVQLIHDELVDQEVICRNDCFEWADFLRG